MIGFILLSEISNDFRLVSVLLSEALWPLLFRLLSETSNECEGMKLSDTSGASSLVVVRSEVVGWRTWDMDNGADDTAPSLPLARDFRDGVAINSCKRKAPGSYAITTLDDVTNIEWVAKCRRVS